MNFQPCKADPKLIVLLVDDDANDQALFALAVAQTDASIWVQSASDGQEAIQYLKGNGKFADRTLHPLPDLVLLDLKMEIGDGFDFLSWRQKRGHGFSAPVVIFTGSQYKKDIERAMELGAVAHIAKPLIFKELLVTVRQISELAKALSSVT